MKNRLLILISVLAVVLGVSGCFKKDMPRAVVNNNANIQQVNENTNANVNLNQNTNTKPKTSQKDIKDISCSDIDYKGEVIKEDNGWKLYVNENLGIEFRFKDEKDEINVVGSRDYIDFGNGSKYNISISWYSKKDYDSLKKFLEVWGETEINADRVEIISIKEIKNLNGVKILEVITDLARFDRITGSTSQHFENIVYYIEYNRPLKCQDDFEYYNDYYENQNYISIRGIPDFQKQIVDSLKFID